MSTSHLSGDANADKAVYSGIAVVVVNSYVNPVSQRATKPVKKLPSNSDAEIKYLKWCCLFQNLGFRVMGGFCINFAGMVQLVSNLQKTESQKFASLVFLMLGYSRKGKFVCEDGLRFDLGEFYTAFSANPLSPWHNKPKCYIMDTFDIPRSWFSRVIRDTPYIPTPPRHAYKDRVVKRSTVYLLISRNVPYEHALSPGMICNDKISNVFFREASTMGCKIFDKLHHLASEIELQNATQPRVDSSPIRPLPGSGSMIGNGITIRDFCDGKFLVYINKPTKGSAAKSKLNLLIEDEDQPWFHGLLTTRRAEERLIKDGDWLIRLSPSYETYGVVFLSLLQRNYYYHLPIRRSHTNLYELGREAKTKLSQLLSQYHDRNMPLHSHNNDLFLRTFRTVPPSDFIEDSQGLAEPRTLDNLINPEVEIINQPWFYGWVGSEQIEPLLREEGAFLARQTPTDTSHWGNFVITSLSRGQLHHTHVHLSTNGQVYINRGELYPTVSHLVAYHFNAQKVISTTQPETSVLLRSYVINPHYPDPMSLPYKEVKFPKPS